MSIFKKCRLIMLPVELEYNPTNKDINIIKTIHNKLYQTYGMDNPPKGFHHLYVISEDRIEDGDWCINGNGKGLLSKYNREFTSIEECMTFKKVIATTDKLPLNDCSTPWTLEHKYVPRPDKSFIEQFIIHYNKDQLIEYVAVEYEKGLSKPLHEALRDYYPLNFERLKVNMKDNTIKISRIASNEDIEAVEFFKPTYNLRWIECSDSNSDGSILVKPIKVLQQLHQGSLGSEKWEDVPTTKE